MVNGWQILPDGALGCCHSRYAGMDCLNHWIPACAGMTGLLVHCHPLCSSALFISIRQVDQDAEKPSQHSGRHPRAAGMTTTERACHPSNGNDAIPAVCLGLIKPFISPAQYGLKGFKALAHGNTGA